MDIVIEPLAFVDIKERVGGWDVLFPLRNQGGVGLVNGIDINDLAVLIFPTVEAVAVTGWCWQVCELTVGGCSAAWCHIAAVGVKGDGEGAAWGNFAFLDLEGKDDHLTVSTVIGIAHLGGIFIGG